MDPISPHFIGEEIEIHFDMPPARQKTPPFPDGFTWRGRVHRIVENISEWHDFTRRGRKAHTSRLAHDVFEAEKGSLGVGRFYFRVRVDTGQVYDLYYDREIKNVDDRLGHWYLYRELG